MKGQFCVPYILTIFNSMLKQLGNSTAPYVHFRLIFSFVDDGILSEVPRTAITEFKIVIDILN